MIVRAVRASDRAVALLAEGVDRNSGVVGQNAVDIKSPSSRRAWIEMPPDKRESDEG